MPTYGPPIAHAPKVIAHVIAHVARRALTCGNSIAHIAHVLFGTSVRESAEARVCGAGIVT